MHNIKSTLLLSEHIFRQRLFFHLTSLLTRGSSLVSSHFLNSIETRKNMNQTSSKVICLNCRAYSKHCTAKCPYVKCRSVVLNLFLKILPFLKIFGHKLPKNQNFSQKNNKSDPNCYFLCNFFRKIWKIQLFCSLES